MIVDNEPKNRKFIQLSSVKIDNLYENSYMLDSAHLLVQPLQLKKRDVFERLIRTNQDYKRYVSHALNLVKTDSEFLLENS